MSSFRVRLATTDDVPALSALAIRCFVQTFVDDLAIPYPKDDLALHLERSYGLEATERLIADSSLFLRVAERGGALLGYVLAGSCQLPHPEASAEHGELRRLYVDYTAHGQGVGRELLDAALEWIAASFHGPEWLGVWSGNLKAQAVYQKRGFEKVGEYDYPVGSWTDHEHIYRRPRR